MAANDYLDFNFNDLPEEFEHDIDGETFTFVMKYNDANDSFYLDVYDSNTPPVPLVLGEKLVYGMDLWNTVNDPRLPAIQIRPVDDDGNEDTVDSSNFPDIIRLEFVDTEDDNDSDIDDTDDSSADINTPSYADGVDDDTNLYGNDQLRSGE